MRFDFYDLDVQTCAIRIKKCDGKNPPNPAILIQPGAISYQCSTHGTYIRW